MERSRLDQLVQSGNLILAVASPESVSDSPHGCVTPPPKRRTTKKESRSAEVGKGRPKSHSVASRTSSSNSDDFSSQQSCASVGRKIRVSAFVSNLYRMASCKAHAEIINFSADGNCLEIRDPDLMGSVLHTYFKHGCLSSFIRQLNNYGFKTVPEPDAKTRTSIKIKTFRHEDFHRGGTEFLYKITRTAGKKVTGRKGDIVKSLHYVETERDTFLNHIRELESQIASLQTGKAFLEEQNGVLRFTLGQSEYENNQVRLELKRATQQLSERNSPQIFESGFGRLPSPLNSDDIFLS